MKRLFKKTIKYVYKLSIKNNEILSKYNEKKKKMRRKLSQEYFNLCI